MYTFLKICGIINCIILPEVSFDLRTLGAMLVMFLLLILLPQAAWAAEQAETDAYFVSAQLDGRGLSSSVTVLIENRTKDTLTFLLRDIALNGECTGSTDEWEVPPGSFTRSLAFRRKSLAPVTVCDLALAVATEEGATPEEILLSICPYGESDVRRPELSDHMDGLAALDNDTAALVILSPADRQSSDKTLWLLNKTDQLLRVRLDSVPAAGDGSAVTIVLQALPRTAQYAALPLPERTMFTMTGYLNGSGDRAVFSAYYDYDPFDPVPAATMVPKVTPRPRLGTVTIRRSGAVNVREGDSTDAKKIGSAKAGQSYACYGISASGWYLIRLEDGTEGYVTNTLTTFKRE